MYNNNYETCSETFATLRIYCNNLQPDKITEYLGLNPQKRK